MQLIIQAPYFRIGTRELWIERVSSVRRRAFLSVARDQGATVITFAGCDLIFSRVSS